MLLNAISDKTSAENMQALYKQHGISADRIADVMAFAIDLPEGIAHSVADGTAAWR